MSEVKVELAGEMPPFYDIAEFLWGKGVDIDSDGNSDHPSSTTWSELTIILRSDLSQRVDIDPAEDGSLKVSSQNGELLSRVISYLRNCGSIK
ncbi:hypothetical protein GCM10008090_34720 [Arenicella chitinivorans]|uniref:Uncharacterized protein n=1 Tax=Arenicella chitinivorans TaxID=1329800 RepID=A0A918S5L1_9GAMM|nr:hypothetical protein [Arenicella chitinivorans]GHA21856.1 hypothetical protein GCM10008090_34720 [Arenicella chitinivorans]